MKLRDMEKLLRDNNYSFVRKGKHDVWSNGKQSLAIPASHPEINKMVAKRLVKQIKTNNKITNG